MALLAPVHLHDGLRIDWKLLVWIDDHTEKARVCLQQAKKGEGLRGLSEAQGTAWDCPVQLGRLCTAQGHPSEGLPFIS